MTKTKGVWGTYWGKIIAFCLVLAFALGAVGICMVYEQKRDIVIDLDDMPEGERSVKEVDDKAIFKFMLDKKGYHFTGFDVYRKDEGDVVLKLYASLTQGEFSKDAEGYYSVEVPIKRTDKKISIEGEDGVVTSIFTLTKQDK